MRERFSSHQVGWERTGGHLWPSTRDLSVSLVLFRETTKVFDFGAAGTLKRLLQLTTLILFHSGIHSLHHWSPSAFFLFSLSQHCFAVIAIFYAICLASLPFVKSHIVWQWLNSSCSSIVAMLRCQMNKPVTMHSLIHVPSPQFKDNSRRAIHVHTCDGGLHPLSFFSMPHASWSDDNHQQPHCHTNRHCSHPLQ